MSNFSESDKRRRSRLRIKLDVLRVLQNSPKPMMEVASVLGTHFYTARNAMIALKKEGLIRKNGNVYVLTDKGREVIPRLERIVTLDDEVRKLMRELDI